MAYWLEVNSEASTYVAYFRHPFVRHIGTHEVSVILKHLLKRGICGNSVVSYLYFSPNIVRVIKSRIMRWAGHVARMGEERGCIGSCWGNRREGNQWGDLGVDGWIILGWISRRWDVGMWTRLGWPRIETGGGRL